MLNGLFYIANTPTRRLQRVIARLVGNNVLCDSKIYIQVVTVGKYYAYRSTLWCVKAASDRETSKYLGKIDEAIGCM